MSDERTYSVVVPTYNEENDIEQCLSSLLNADLNHDRLEVLVADGMSEDATRDIVHEYESTTPVVQLLDNPNQTTPHGFNTAVSESTNSVVVFIGGHSWVPRDFFERINEAFDERAPDVDVVGGVMVPTPANWFEGAVAGALTSRVGASSTRFRAVEGYVETVNYGAYRREVIEDVGSMDVDLPRAQDYEYNRRVREHGYRIYQYPRIEVMYRPRSSPMKLAKQYFGSGYWKGHVFQQHGDHPAVVATTGRLVPIAGLLLLLFTPLVSALLIGSVVYLLVVLLASGHSVAENDLLAYRHAPGAAAALVIMHVSYFSGLLSYFVRSSR